MSKKKNFKGLTNKIVQHKVTSIDDFLGAEEATPESEPAAVHPAKNEKPKPIKQPKKSASKTDPDPPEEPEKTRITLFLASRISYELDELKMKIRRDAPRSDMSKVSKSSIVEAAVDIVKADFESNGVDCELVKRLLE